jgi:methylisocitrate lyase
MSTTSLSTASPGARLRLAIQRELPLQVVGVIHAYAALQAEQSGFQALYLSGAGVANAAYGLPDLGITNLNDVLIEVRRITQATNCPLLVDADTGWGNIFNIQRTVRELEDAGAAGLHLEDQVAAKRCGHRPHKQVVSTDEMCDRIKSAVDARTDASFFIMARCDALANEGLDAALARMQAYVAAGADAIFAEAVTELSDYQTITSSLSVPVLANMTEFGMTPLYTVEELRAVGIKMVLYPLSAFRAMNAAALQVYQTIREQGTQKNVVDLMQTREALYQTIHYHSYEQKIDELLGQEEE